IFYLPLTEVLFQKFKKDCSIKEEKKGQLRVNEVNRRYNFKANDDTDITIHFKIINEGEGLAKDIEVRIVENDNFSSNTPRKLGILQPNEIRTFDLPVRVKPETDKEGLIILNINWLNVNGGSNEIEQELLIEAQSDNINWDDLRNNS